jgi:microcin C transport system substrate-binding protein
MSRIIKLLLITLCSSLLYANAAHAAKTLPDNIEWLTNDEDPVYASPQAKPGGTLHSMMLSFPLTMRFVGPDSNGGFRSAILGNQFGPVAVHPNTLKLIPVIATHWAYSDDNKTMYFRINPKARWSDGKQVTAQDFAFSLEFYRSKDIIAPWYNTFYTDEIDRVDIYDDLTFSVSSTKARPRDELHSYVGFNPAPRHFYKDMSDFVRKYNWKVSPTTGPYQITEVKKGRHITFKRKKDWWAKDLKYFKNRFNVDKVKYTVIRDINLAWEHFKKGKLDVFGATLPLYWHEKATGPIFDKGYAHKLWFYTDAPQGSTGLWLNMDNPVLADRNVRLGIAYAMNIDKVINQVLRGDYQRKHNFSSGFGVYTDKDIRARAYDLEKANQHFDAAGWNEWGKDGIRVKDGQRLSLTITYGSDTHTPRLVVLKEEFKKAGVEMNLRLLDSAASFKSVLEKKHDIWWGALIGGRWPQYWGQFHSVNAHKPQTNNFTNTDDKELDKVIEAYRSAVSTGERADLARQIQRFIYEQGAWIPTYEVPYERIVFWRWVKLPESPGTRLGGPGVFPFDFGGAFDVSDGGLLWIDKDSKEETKKAMKSGKTCAPVTDIDTTFKAGD